MIATVNDLIARHYGHLASRRKRLARDAEVSERTAENWLSHDRLCEPRPCSLKSIAMNNEAFRDDLIAWLSEEK